MSKLLFLFLYQLWICLSSFNVVCAVCACDLDASTRWNPLLSCAISIRDERLLTRLIYEQFLKDVSMWTQYTDREESQHTFHFFAPQECPVAALKMESVLERSRCWWMPSVWPFCPDCALHMCRECIQIKWWTLMIKILKKNCHFKYIRHFKSRSKKENSCVCNYFFSRLCHWLAL